MVARWIIFRKNDMTFHIHVPKHAQSNPSSISMINDSDLSLVYHKVKLHYNHTLMVKYKVFT